MWVVFRKSDRKIIGTSAQSRIELEKAKAIAELVRGHAEGAKISDFDAVQVRDLEQIRKLRDPSTREHVQIQEEPGGGLELSIEQPESFSLAVGTSVGLRHPVDETALVPADGETITEVTIQKIDQNRKPVARAQDDDRLFLRADHGVLLDTKGEPVYHLRLSRGEGAFQLRSGSEARLATVRVFNGDPNLEDASIQIEFVPPGAEAPEEQPAPFGSGKKTIPIGAFGPEARFGVTEVSGIGGKLGRQLAVSGVSTVGDLLAAEPAQLAATLGTSVRRVEKLAERGRSLLEPAAD